MTAAAASDCATMVEDRHVNSLCVPFAYRDEPEKCQAYLRDLAAYLRSKGWLDLDRGTGRLDHSALPRSVLG